jgi:hypothetical protein
MDEDKRAFYEYHASLMEPWDGPAAIAFTDGRVIGATLDRNGLRPGRYVVTKDDLVVLASETGVIEVPPEEVRKKGRLQPGRMFLVDTVQKRIISDGEIKKQLASRQPYGEWLKNQQITLDMLPEPSRVIGSRSPRSKALLRFHADLPDHPFAAVLRHVRFCCSDSGLEFVDAAVLDFAVAEAHPPHSVGERVAQRL